MKTVILTAVVAAFTATDSLAVSPELQFTNIVSVYDADTFKVDLPCNIEIVCKNVPIRVLGADTPEIRGACFKEKYLATLAGNYVRNLLSNAKTIRITDYKRGKYFRIVGRVIVDGQDLAEHLIELEMAKPYDGGKKKSWCESRFY